MASLRSCRLPTHLTAAVPQILKLVITRINSNAIGIYPGEELLITVDIFLGARYGKFKGLRLTDHADLFDTIL